MPAPALLPVGRLFQAVLPLALSLTFDLMGKPFDLLILALDNLILVPVDLVEAQALGLRGVKVLRRRVHLHSERLPSKNRTPHVTRLNGAACRPIIEKPGQPLFGSHPVAQFTLLKPAD